MNELIGAPLSKKMNRDENVHVLIVYQEEKAELRAQNYLLEKEKSALELRLSGKESREQAYVIQIEHLKSEVEESNRAQVCTGVNR